MHPLYKTYIFFPSFSVAMSVAPVSALCLLFLLSVCTACYISNCPIGGKRAALDFPSRKCMSCGPGDMGCCFGPSICCGEGMGCYMGSPEAASCVEENYLTYPCELLHMISHTPPQIHKTSNCGHIIAGISSKLSIIHFIKQSHRLISVCYL
uniref:Oxytocin n=1 Tax=Oncorhynchus mykiss TaxID=8022 RepID=A0A8C7SL05_ONCMY